MKLIAPLTNNKKINGIVKKCGTERRMDVHMMIDEIKSMMLKISP